MGEHTRLPPAIYFAPFLAGCENAGWHACLTSKVGAWLRNNENVEGELLSDVSSPFLFVRGMFGRCRADWNATSRSDHALAASIRNQL